MRIAVGDEKLTYLASYGTDRFGLCRDVPGKVRAMILDGGRRSECRPDSGGHRSGPAFQQAFNDFAADCAKSPIARWAPIRRRPSMSTAPWSTRWWTNRR